MALNITLKFKADLIGFMPFRSKTMCHSLCSCIYYNTYLTIRSGYIYNAL